MAEYRRKPTTVKAVQWDGSPQPGVTEISQEGTPFAQGMVTTMQGRMVLISVGEWVVEEANGNGHYPVDDAEFKRIYEPASPSPASGSDVGKSLETLASHIASMDSGSGDAALMREAAALIARLEAENKELKSFADAAPRAIDALQAENAEKTKALETIAAAPLKVGNERERQIAKDALK